MADIAARELTGTHARHAIVGIVHAKAPVPRVVSLARKAMNHQSAYYFAYMIAEALLPGRFAALRPKTSLLAYAARNDLPVMPASTINEPSILRFVRETGADALLSLRPGQIFRSGFIAEAPPILNLHCTRLPDYRGMGGILQAMAAGEAEHGISAHRIMSEAVDDGPLLAQRVVSAIAGASLYHQTLALYAQASGVVADGLDALASRQTCPKQGEGSLHSWPGPAPRRALRRRGQALIRLSEFFRAPLKLSEF
ncbi:MAG: formyltransferase family protein [Alphaproteobacteria bacterium]